MPAFDKIIPVMPPNVNKNIKPIENSNGVLKISLPPHIVAIQLKIFMPVGTAIVIVAAEKYALASKSNPTVYMW
jgi:hypothetical protein